MKEKVFFGLMLFAFALTSYSGHAQERPYFITYSHEMEEPGNLEIKLGNVAGKPPSGSRFLGSALELEYGAAAWWTIEAYLDGQVTQHDSTVFTGYRWENRFRPLLREHWINPVIYVEFGNINGADKSLLEIVGHDAKDNLIDPNGQARTEKKREIELKLILGSNYKGWNISENFVMEKNLAGGPWEFGYAWGVRRPISLAAKSHNCTFCGEKFQAGVEMYGGLGERYSFGTSETSHYFGPAINWSAPNGLVLSFSPQFGLNDHSVPHLFRFGVSYEIDQFLSRFHGGNK